MDLSPETENGSAPLLGCGDWRDQRKQNNMSISELVSKLRDTFLMSDFDRVEETLMTREASLKAEIEEKKKEIGLLQEEVGFERLERINAELELKRLKEERCERLVKLEENNNNDVKVVKKCERCKLEELKRKRVGDDGDGSANAVHEVEGEKIEVLAEKKRWVDERGVVEGDVRSENSLLLKVESWKRKFCELNEGKKMIENDVRGSASLKRNEDVKASLGAGAGNKDGLGLGASGGRLGRGIVIDIEDSDEDECNSQATLNRKETATPIIAENEHLSSSGALQKNLPTGVAEPIGIRKREFASFREFGTNINILDSLDSDTSSSSSSSSSGSLDMDSLPMSSLTSKKMRTDASSIGLNSSTR